MSVTILEQANLEYREGGSDKVYNVFLELDGAAYEVRFAYGRRGSTLTRGSKVKTGSEQAARKTYLKLVSEKLGKGYVDTGKTSTSGSVITSVKKASGFLPQLLNEVEQFEVEDYLTDDDWCMQEKFDGERRTLIFEDGVITAANKKGQEIGLSGEIGKAFLELTDRATQNIILDGEDMGSYIMLFDKISDLPCESRYTDLVLTVGINNNTLRVCDTAWTTEKKINLFKELKARNAEGVVFKRKDSRYLPGRPSSYGPCIKFKFKDTCSCIVLAQNVGKSSIKLGVTDGVNRIAVGNTTVYANQTMPQVGDIVEVEYLYYYKDGSLFQPVLKGIRNDVDESECLISKLKLKPETDE
jgi:bifunctional non-homologous end joining protein LigD